MFTARHRLEMPSLPRFENPKLQSQLEHKIDTQGSLKASSNQLEQLALHLGLILNSQEPQIKEPQLLVFAADSGLTDKTKVTYTPPVTQQQVNQFLSGTGALQALANQQAIQLRLVDAGLAANLPAHPKLLSKKVMSGTRNSLKTQAMNAEECLQAIFTGMALVRETPGNLLILGKLGLGHDPAASLLLSKLGALPLEDCLDSATNRDLAGPDQQALLKQVLHKHRLARNPLEVLAALGSLEIAMMTGALLQAASERRILLIDGLVVASALLVAECLQPGIKHFAVFSHQSSEPGHRQLLQLFKARPLLDLDLDLGEGAGALLAYPLLPASLTAFTTGHPSLQPK
ncbi:nicotinate-nucleotide-dimethylbenzimidazole phosphoribosyltransferase [Marinospirillum celere]|uniref:Nicotinate-nucleotide--dimethylbenzimidazole phosphoribosyltransferase n=1 Tax=Marinospirillum celere TaxID=1122252 RepID=A0A1I1ERY3_9GAMM|nr:nicotinate-nucleotide--dimethylbenzimidazole phosphoribosyltransferase [Marinospirillum celere]SFB89885.1 nicotinate-nucleotide-dimethylbenzimidazole phosphoribosyltransferase [Marinospirillum celere]